MAHLGQIEQEGICLGPQLDRAERLKLAATMLDPGELVRVETIAVPRHIRQTTLQQLADVIYAEDNFWDSLWAACWMILVGFHLHPDFPFDESDSDQFPGGETNCRLFCTFGEAVGGDRARRRAGMDPPTPQLYRRPDLACAHDLLLALQVQWPTAV